MDWHQGIPGNNWDDNLFTRGGHFLQSSHWAAFNVKLGKQVFYANGDGWQCLAIIEPSKSGKRIYAPYGPFAANKKNLLAAIEALKKLARQQKAMFARIEPIVASGKINLAEFGLKPALKSIQPPQTLILDITKSQEEILAGFTPTNRNLCRTAANKGLSFKASSDPADVKYLLKMVHDVATHTGIKQHSDDYYMIMAESLLPRGAGKIYIAFAGKDAVGAAFVFDSPTTRYYAHAGNLLSARKLHPGAPLLATMIFDAKSQGQKNFDFVGVAPSGADQTHPWMGFTKFKKSFGGEYKQYLGTWELPISGKYHIYRSAYQAYKALRHKR